MCGSETPYYNALPGNLKPVHYNVSIYDITADAYSGTVTIDLQVAAATSELLLHYRDLTIAEVSAACEGRTIACKVAEENKAKEVFVIGFAEKLATVGAVVSVTVKFTGTIQTNMAGFYKLAYKEDGCTKQMLSTQFEATDARRAFPCLDEPALKATFSVEIATSPELTVLGNMPVESERVSDGVKVVSFQKTPVMSTYLLAWAIGEFEYIEGFTDELYYNEQPLPVRIYTTKGYTKDAELALSLAPKIVDYFSKVFQLKYPLPKLDLIAVHSFSHNAMENWGLITYRSTALLFSEGTSDPSYKQNVAYVVAHEIAHQWFGNLVTMQWWDELWLNEGFATWVGYKAVDYLFPEWDIFAGFVLTSLQTALRLDGLRNSHPIKVPVVDALDIDQLFDAISYLKGASTILMLSSYLGTDVFLQGVAKYLASNQFANATSDDLWNAISEISGKPVGRMMESWITKIGYPAVSVSFKNSQLVLEQARFLNGGGVKPDEDETLWWVPLNVSTTAEVAQQLGVDSFSSKTISTDVVPTGFFKLNKDTEGAFRVNYDPEVLNTCILPHFTKLTAKDKVGVIADVAAIAVSDDEHTSTTTFLDLAKSATIDNDLLGETYVVWLELCSRLSALATTFSGADEELTAKVFQFCKQVYSKLAVLLLAQNVDSSDFLKCKLKSQILKVASAYDIPEVQQHAKQLFDEWKTTKKIDPALRYFTFSSTVASKDLTVEDFDLIMTEVTHPTSLDSREVALGALGHIANKELAQKLIAYLTDESVIPVMDAHFLASTLSQNVAVRASLWEFFKQNYTRLHELMSTNMVVLDRFIKVTLCHYQSYEMESDVKAFFADKDIHGFERSYHQVLDQIRINAAWYERDAEKVKQWLTQSS